MWHLVCLLEIVAHRSLRPGLLAAALLGTALGAVACSSAPDEDAAQSEDAVTAPADRFPEGFAFGTAVAGFQVDMGCPTLPAAQCEDRASDWYQWITTKRIVDNPVLFMSKDAPGSGPGFYETHEQDLQRAAGPGPDELGGNAFRLSIEWSRIFPQATFGIDGHDALTAVASADGIAYYHRLFAAMKARGLRPFVTVNHYSLPLWIHDGNLCNEGLDRCIAARKAGWADPDRSRITTEIAKYARFLGEEYGGEVDTWATLNEPFSAVVVAGYLASTPMRSNPPGLSGPWMHVDGARTAASAMVEANARIYDALKASDTIDADRDGKPADVGIVYSYSHITPKTGNDQDARAAANAHYFFEDMFMDGVVKGRLDETWDHAPGTAPVRADLAGRADFIGVNYYFGFEAQHFLFPLSFISPHITFNMLQPFDENDPDGLRDVLVQVSRRYGKPVYVTETGATQDDPERAAAWLVRTVAATRDARKQGADVRGFFAWSLMDNYEWNHGMGVRFGLYAVDRASPTKARKLRSAGAAFAQMTRARGVTPALAARYANAFR